MRLLNIFIAFAMLNLSLQGAVVNKQCTYSGETEFFPVGDQRGNSILTKKEVHADCNITISAQGPCKKWEDKDTEFFLDPADYNTYKSNNYNGALGSALAIMGAYDQIGHFWSGWHGYCEKGTKYDFSWAQDPMFWASLVMGSLIEGSNTQGDVLEGSMDSVTDAAGNAWSSLAISEGLDLGQNFGACLLSAGVDLGTSVYKYFKPDDAVECDPVDEFCDEYNEPQEADIMTLDESQYNDLISEHPEYSKYITVLDSQDGIVTVAFKPISKIEGLDKKSQEEMEKAKSKMKKIQFEISSAITAVKMAACAMSDGDMGTGTSYDPSTGNRFSVKKGIGMAINSLPADWLGPFGSIIKAGLKVVLEFLTSFKDIDTCHNEKDAKEAGSRHLKTYETLPYNLCQFTEKTCAQEKFFGSGCGLDAYHYCCYDQMLTKILVAQIKAQLGRDWAHCTGITLKDLNFVSFRQCTEDDKKLGFDGTKIVLKYNVDNEVISPKGWNDGKWLNSYQHKAKCIDLTEFKKYLESTFSQDIDFSDFDRIFKETGNQKDYLP